MVHALDIMEREGDRVYGCLNAEVSLVLESLGLDSNTNDMEHVVKKKHDREFAIEMRRQRGGATEKFPPHSSHISLLSFLPGFDNFYQQAELPLVNGP